MEENSKQKEKTGIKLFRIIILCVIACIVAFIIGVAIKVLIIPTFVYSPFITTESVYVSSDGDDEFILKICDKNEMILYHFVEDETLFFTAYHGRAIHYLCNGVYYNHVIGDIHYLPKDTVFYLSRYKLYDNNEKRAAVTLEVSAIDILDTSPGDIKKSDKFDVTICIKDDILTMGDLTFSEAQPEEMDHINEVIDRFDNCAVPIEGFM